MGGGVTGVDMEGGDDGAEEEGGDDGAEEGGCGDELDIIVVISVEETAESGGTAMEDSLDIVDGTCTGDDGDSKIQSAVVRQWGRTRGRL